MIVVNKYTLELSEEMLEATKEKCRLELLRVLEKSKEWEGFDQEEYDRLKKILES